MTEKEPRTAHPAEPAEGADSPGRSSEESSGPEGTGRTPHPDEPAEGGDTDEQPGVDPESRITGV
jgi:hypothetical protein